MVMFLFEVVTCDGDSTGDARANGAPTAAARVLGWPGGTSWEGVSAWTHKVQEEVISRPTASIFMAACAACLPSFSAMYFATPLRLLPLPHATLRRQAFLSVV